MFSEILAPGQQLGIATSLVMVVFALALAYGSASSTRLASPAFIFVVISVVEVFIGNLQEFLAEGRSNPPLIALSILAVAAGAFLTGSRTNRRPNIGVWEPLRSGALPTVLITGGIVTAATYVVLYGAGAGDLLSPSNLRIQQLTVAAAAPRYSFVLALYLPVILTLGVLAQAISRRSKRLYVLALLMGVGTSGLMTLLAERHIIFQLAIAWFILASLGGRRMIRINIATGLMGLGIAAAEFVYVGIVRSAIGVTDWAALPGVAWRVIADRVFYQQAHVVWVLMDSVPRYYPYFNGYTIASQVFRLPGDSTTPFELGSWLYPQLHLGVPTATVGYATPTVFGEFYANFGPSIAVALMFALGLVLGWYERRFRESAKTGVWKVVIYAAVAMLISISTVPVYDTLHDIIYVLTLVAVLAGLAELVSRSSKGSISAQRPANDTSSLGRREQA